MFTYELARTSLKYSNAVFGRILHIALTII